MTNMFLSFLEISVPISLIIAVLLLLTPVLNKWYAAKWKYWIWIVLAMRLLIPLGVNAGQPAADGQPQVEMLTSSESEKTSPDALTDGAARGRVIVEIPARLTTPIVRQSEKTGGNISMLDITALVWMLGSLLLISVHLVSYFHYKHQILKNGKMIKDNDVLRLLLKLKHELHINCTVSVIEYPEVASPLLIGFCNHILVLPKEHYNSEELFFILKHELVHLKRGDIYLKLLFAVANAVHWYNPLVWIMQKEAAIDMELSCDERVTQGADYAMRKAYTETLLSALHKQSARKSVLSTGFYGGKQVMKKRFKNILTKKGKKNGVAVLICAIMLAVSLGTLAGCSFMEENTEEEFGILETENVPDESIQTNEPSPNPDNDSFEAEHSGSDYPAETSKSSAEDTKTQTVQPSPTKEVQDAGKANLASTGEKAQDTESYDADEEYFYLTWNPLLLDYYNTYSGQKALYDDFADLADEGMSIAVSVSGDDILVVTVRYEDITLLTEGIKEKLEQQLESLSDRVEKQMNLYCTDIIGPASVREIFISYTDPSGNILAEKEWAGQ